MTTHHMRNEQIDSQNLISTCSMVKPTIIIINEKAKDISNFILNKIVLKYLWATNSDSFGMFNSKYSSHSLKWFGYFFKLTVSKILASNKDPKSSSINPAVNDRINNVNDAMPSDCEKYWRASGNLFINKKNNGNTEKIPGIKSSRIIL